MVMAITNAKIRLAASLMFTGQYPTVYEMNFRTIGSTDPFLMVGVGGGLRLVTHVTKAIQHDSSM